jgi:hypothetical protein
MGRDIWQAKVPLICFYIVEWHAPDRVLRQFNLGQDVPDPINTEDSLHEMIFDARTNWIQRLTNYIEIWNDRRTYVISGGAGDIYSYMDWYRTITRRFISRRNMLSDHMVSYMNLYILLDIILYLFVFYCVFFLFCYSFKEFNKYKTQPELKKYQAICMAVIYKAFARSCFRHAMIML